MHVKKLDIIITTYFMYRYLEMKILIRWLNQDKTETCLELSLMHV